eukprot:scaffold112756_cov19-Prasinocladus_malaysianus.AAC.1
MASLCHTGDRIIVLGAYSARFSSFLDSSPSCTIKISTAGAADTQIIPYSFSAFPRPVAPPYS